VISIRYFAPAPALRRHLSSYYWFESTAPVFSDLMRAELGQIRIVTCGKAVNHYANGCVRPSGAMQLQGPTSGPVRFVAEGRLQLFGIGLLPLGWATLVGVPADELADDIADLGAVVGLPARHLVDAMASAHDDPARVAVADCFFTRLLLDPYPAPLWFSRLCDDWLTGSSNPSVDRLVDSSGMSARSIERLAKRVYGASPKLLSRKYRALHAAVQMGNGEAGGWNDIACAGFYDQAHFIREFKQFMGVTPSRFQEDAAAVHRLTIVRKRLMPDLPKLALYS
jgi:AraC-like DNA-binding protein